MNKEVISVVVPVYQEELVIQDFYNRLIKQLKDMNTSYDIIFVDDQSDTPTLEILRKIRKNDKNVKIISLSKNYGHQIALSAGIDYAKGDAVIMLDGDLQHPPELIATLVEHWKNGYDIVYTIRKELLKRSFLRQIANKLFYFLMSKITDVDMGFNCADFRLMSRKAADGFKQIKEKTRFIRGLTSWMGFKKIGIPFYTESRKKGKTKYSVNKIFSFALDGIISFSNFPIKIISIIGILISLVSFLYIIRVAYFMIFANEPMPDWLPITSIILFLSGIQMLMLGIIGEYVSKIFIETKNRPLYLIDEIYE
jgi:dolichol-phosphate mannosyltransferase